MMVAWCASAVLLVLAASVRAAYEGDVCYFEGSRGTCRIIRDCPAAIEGIKQKKPPQVCGFSGNDVIVCCGDAASARPTTAAPAPLTTARLPASTPSAPYVPPVYDYHYDDGASGVCPPIDPSTTAKKTGRKAWDKCIDYQELVYPCERENSLALANALVRGNHCNHNVFDLVIGGVEAKVNEFPHMALLGFGDSQATAQWLCGGSLISDRFVLTAGHCTFARDVGDVKFLRLGALKRTDPFDPAKAYNVARIIKHPEYRPPSKYNDIALLQTERAVPLNRFTVPACLHAGEPVNDTVATATGWGVTQYKGDNADVLQKVKLERFSQQECAQKFPPERLMKQGYNAATQSCFGHHSEVKDTCQGDSGGPMQVANRAVHCMYTVVGITSFGKACGFVGSPAIYTRVAGYVPWIESQVWP